MYSKSATLYHCNVERHERDPHDHAAPVVLGLRVDVRLVVGEDVGHDAVRLLGRVGATARLKGNATSEETRGLLVRSSKYFNENYLQIIHRMMTEQKRIFPLMILVLRLPSPLSSLIAKIVCGADTR